MATLFNITVPSNVLNLDATRTGQITFTVANTSARSLGTNAQVVPSDPAIQSWFQIEQGAARHLDPHQTVQYIVTVHIPENAPPQSYTFHLVVADESNPDDNFNTSPDVRVTAPPPAAPPAKKPFPWWIIAVAVVVVIVIIIIIAAVVGTNQARSNADATSTAAANATANAATQTAVFLAQQGATQTAEFLAQQGATQTQQFLNEHAATATVQFFQTQTALAVFATQTQQARPTATPTARPPATVTVSNNGGFFAQFSVSYNFSGGFQTQTTGQFGAGSSQSISIPGDAFNISVQIQDNTGFNLRNACDPFNFSPAQNKHYSVSGGTFNTSCSEP
jgi:hypothetical protein